MEFKKYQSIENTYRSNNIERWVGKFPELLTCKYIVSEKIHGANWQVSITKDEIKYGKRTSWLEKDEKFFGYQAVVAKYEDEFNKIQKYLKSLEDVSEIKFYGELYGGNIQNGIDYGKEKHIRFFDLVLDGELQPQKKFVETIDLLDLSHMCVPILAILDDLESALSYNIKFDTLLFEKEDNICEGVVIKPYEKVYRQSDDGGSFYLKNKNSEFSEKKNKKKRTNFVSSDNFVEAQAEFTSLLTENRVDGIMSKNGRIEDMGQIGDYIKLIVTDAKDDYLKDNWEQFISLNDREKGKLFSSASKVIVPILKEYM